MNEEREPISISLSNNPVQDNGEPGKVNGGVVKSEGKSLDNSL